MSKKRSKGVEEARSELPRILEEAERGQSTIITRHGKPVAAIVPLSRLSAQSQEPLTTVSGSGRGLWDRAGGRSLRKLRDEWTR